MEKGISDWDRVRQICSKIWPTWETATGKAFKCLKSLQEIFESDRWQIHKSWWCHIAVGISPSRVHFILKRVWKNERLLPDTAHIDRWPKKTGTSTNCCMQLLKMVPKFNQRQIANIATGNETWVHSFEPVWKIGNKWPAVAKRTVHKLKEGSLYSIFFSCDGIAVQISVPKGKVVTCRRYPYILLKKSMQFEKY